MNIRFALFVVFSFYLGSLLFLLGKAAISGFIFVFGYALILFLREYLFLGFWLLIVFLYYKEVVLILLWICVHAFSIKLVVDHFLSIGFSLNIPFDSEKLINLKPWNLYNQPPIINFLILLFGFYPLIWLWIWNYGDSSWLADYSLSFFSALTWYIFYAEVIILHSYTSLYSLDM